MPSLPISSAVVGLYVSGLRLSEVFCVSLREICLDARGKKSKVKRRNGVD